MFSFETVIGVEVHAALNTRTKMFSPAKNAHGDAPNANVHVNDLGLPGTLPQPNAEAVRKALILARALHMKNVDTLLRFDRKNYFYQDLPKGFQITQQYHPFATDGRLDAYLDGRPVSFPVQRFHIEEDTAKQFVSPDGMLLDYNRAGCPLIEIVTDPVFRSGAEVRAYLTWLRLTLLHNGISDARMEAGSMRADINLSLRPFGAKGYGTRVEIKNVNSVANAQRAIEAEAASQAARLLAGIPVAQATLRFDDATGTTQFMRAKTDAIDYRYMREPNIVQIALSDAWVREAEAKCPPRFPAQTAKDLREQGLDAAQTLMVMESPPLLEGFLGLAGKWGAKTAARWLLTELAGVLNAAGKSFDDVSADDCARVSGLIALIDSGKVSARQGKELLPLVFVKKEDPAKLAAALGMEQITDPKALRDQLQKLIAANEGKVKDGYPQRPERIEAMILGFLMKETRGRADPVAAAAVLKELLSPYAAK